MLEPEAVAGLLVSNKGAELKALVQKEIDDGVDPKTIIVDGLFAAMAIVGEKFRTNEVYVPELLISFRTLEQVLPKADIEPVGKLVVGTAKGDLHDIGKNLVSMMFKGAGFEVIDIGIDCTAEQFVEAAKEKGAGLIGVSALLTTTMPQMKTVVEAKNAAGIDTKIIIGGAPVTQAYADEIGADGYAPDAASAVDVGKRLLGL